MPRRSRYTTDSADQLGPRKIGEILEARRKEIKPKGFLVALEASKECLDHLSKVILIGRDHGVVGPKREKLRYFDELMSKLGGPIASLNALKLTIWSNEERQVLKKIAERQGLVKSDFVGPRDEDPAVQGRRLQAAMDSCLEMLDGPEPPTGSFERIVSQLVTRGFKSIRSELARLEILGVCEHCGYTFYPSRTTKKYCSVAYEDRNCAVNARSARFYRKTRRPHR